MEQTAQSLESTCHPRNPERIFSELLPELEGESIVACSPVKTTKQQQHAFELSLLQLLERIGLYTFFHAGNQQVGGLLGHVATMAKCPDPALFPVHTVLAQLDSTNRTAAQGPGRRHPFYQPQQCGLRRVN